MVLLQSLLADTTYRLRLSQRLLDPGNPRYFYQRFMKQKYGK